MLVVSNAQVLSLKWHSLGLEAPENDVPRRHSYAEKRIAAVVFFGQLRILTLDNTCFFSTRQCWSEWHVSDLVMRKKSRLLK